MTTRFRSTTLDYSSARSRPVETYRRAVEVRHRDEMARPGDGTVASLLVSDRVGGSRWERLIFSKDPDGLTTSGAFLALPRTRARHVLQFVGPDPDVAEPLAWPERRPALDRLTGRALVVLAEREPWVELRRRFRAEPLPAAPTSLLPIHELQGLVTDHVAHAPKLAWLEGGSRRHRCPRRRGPRRSARSNVTTVVPGTVESFLPGTRRGGRSAHLAPRDTRLPGQKSFPSTT